MRCTLEMACSLAGVLEKQRCEQPALVHSSLALVHSTAESDVPIWCRSAHICLTHPAKTDALRTVSGCLRPTPADNLPILDGIQSDELRCKGATLSLARRPIES